MRTPPYSLPNLPFNPASWGILLFPSAWPASPGGCLSSFPRAESSAPRYQCHHLKMLTKPTDREWGWDPILLASAAEFPQRQFFCFQFQALSAAAKDLVTNTADFLNFAWVVSILNPDTPNVELSSTKVFFLFFSSEVPRGPQKQ